MTLRIITFGLFLLFAGPTLSWITARIILPDMGLTVPGWSKFFWSFVIAGLFYASYQFVAGLLFGDG